jgi:hypothetical protein
MNIKPSMKFRVVQGRNPKTGGTVQRPLIVERETYYLDQVVQYALNAGYVRGQFHDMRGALNGFIQAMQQLGKDGKAVNLTTGSGFTTNLPERSAKAASFRSATKCASTSPHFRT